MRAGVWFEGGQDVSLATAVKASGARAARAESVSREGAEASAFAITRRAWSTFPVHVSDSATDVRAKTGSSVSSISPAVASPL
jgi:hypothetical protein